MQEIARSLPTNLDIINGADQQDYLLYLLGLDRNDIPGFGGIEIVGNEIIVYTGRDKDNMYFDIPGWCKEEVYALYRSEMTDGLNKFIIGKENDAINEKLQALEYKSTQGPNSIIA